MQIDAGFESQSPARNTKATRPQRDHEVFVNFFLARRKTIPLLAVIDFINGAWRRENKGNPS
jgi:hypothetical protein